MVRLVRPRPRGGGGQLQARPELSARPGAHSERNAGLEENHPRIWEIVSNDLFDEKGPPGGSLQDASVCSYWLGGEDWCQAGLVR